MKEEYREIDPELLKLINGNAWSIENMDAHGAGGRSTTYIGSRKEKHTVYDYYRDNAGAFWYKSRAILPSGEIVSMERYIFGHEIRKNTYPRYKNK